MRSRGVEADTRVERTERSCGLARIRRGKPVVARGVVGRRCLICFILFDSTSQTLRRWRRRRPTPAPLPPRTHRPSMAPDDRRPPPPHPPPRTRRPLSVVARVSRRAYVSHHRRAHGAAAIEHRRCRSPRLPRATPPLARAADAAAATCAPPTSAPPLPPPPPPQPRVGEIARSSHDDGATRDTALKSRMPRAVISNARVRHRARHSTAPPPPPSTSPTRPRMPQPRA